MKKFLSILAFWLVSQLGLLAAGQHQDYHYRTRDIPNVQLFDARRFVSNPDHILSEEAVVRIDTMLLSLKNSGKAQVVVVAVNSIGNQSPFDFLHQLLSDWGVGRKDADDGLGILLVIDQGAIEIQTGYGLEGDLPDAILKRIINDRMLPAFSRRDWDKGMIDGVTAIVDILNGRIPSDISDSDDLAAWICLFLFFLLPITVLLVVSYLSGRCPKCHKKTLKRVDSSVIIDKNNIPVRVETYVCQNCGFITTKRHSNHDDEGGGMIIGGGLGGLFSGMGGGGFGSGGGFGGGSFGGGGARGRF